MLNWNVIDFISPMLFNIFIIFIIIVIIIIFIFTDFLVPLFFVLLFFLRVLICCYVVSPFCYGDHYYYCFHYHLYQFLNHFLFCFTLFLFAFSFYFWLKLLFSNETFNVSKMLCLLVICFFDLFFFLELKSLGETSQSHFFSLVPKSFIFFIY